MGWSCRQEAYDVEQAWSKACRQSTGSQNTWKEGSNSYFYDISSKEHDDGAITGKIWKMGKNNQCTLASHFRIEGNGTITKAPKFLKDAAK